MASKPRQSLTETLTRALFGSPAPGLSTLFDAALLFVRGHYLLTWPEKGVMQQKYLSAQAVRQALLLEEVDLCLPSGMRRYGSGPKGEWFLQMRPARQVTLLLQDPRVAQRDYSKAVMLSESASTVSLLAWLFC